MVMAFSPQETGQLTGVYFAHVLNRNVSEDLTPVSLNVMVSTDQEGAAIIASGQLVNAFDWGSEQRGSAQEFFFLAPVQVTAGKTYYLRLRPDEGVTLDFAGMMALEMSDVEGAYKQPWQNR